MSEADNEFESVECPLFMPMDTKSTRGKLIGELTEKLAAAKAKLRAAILAEKYEAAERFAADVRHLTGQVEEVRAYGRAERS